MPPQLFCCLLLTFFAHLFIMASCLSVSRTVFLLPKKGKNVTCSSSYCPIALASTLKVLEHVILTKYSSFLCSYPLQFGFKPGFSTTLCTVVVKNVISHYIHNSSRVHGCFLDASKAFDLVDHSLLFAKLIDHGLPLPVVHFLSFWYGSQKMKVRWENLYLIHFMYLMVLNKAVLCLQFCSLLIWMVCQRS